MVSKRYFSKQWLYLGLLAFGAIVLGACQSTSSTIEATKASDKITVQVALEENVRPLSYTDTEGHLVGYEVDVLEAINKKLEDYQISYEAVSGEAAEVGLETGKYGAIGGGLFYTDERAQKHLYPTENTGVSTIEIYRRKSDVSLQTLEDLVGKKLSPVTANGGIFNLLTKYNEAHPDKKITIPLGESGELAQRYQGLADGKYDAVVMPANFGADDIITSLKLDIVTADQPVQVNATYFLLGKDQKEFQEDFDQAVKALKEEGVLSDLSEKWFGEDMFQYQVTEN